MGATATDNSTVDDYPNPGNTVGFDWITDENGKRHPVFPAYGRQIVDQTVQDLRDEQMPNSDDHEQLAEEAVMDAYRDGEQITPDSIWNRVMRATKWETPPDEPNPIVQQRLQDAGATQNENAPQGYAQGTSDAGDPELSDNVAPMPSVGTNAKPPDVPNLEDFTSSQNVSNIGTEPKPYTSHDQDIETVRQKLVSINHDRDLVSKSLLANAGAADPSAFVEQNPDLAYEIFKKQHENDNVTLGGVVDNIGDWIKGAAKGVATGVPKFISSGQSTIKDVATMANGQTPEQEKTRAANELMGGAISGTTSAVDLVEQAKRATSAFSSLLTGGLIGSRDKDLSKDDVIAILKRQSEMRKVQEAVQKGDMPTALKLWGMPDKVADRFMNPEDLQKVGYSGQRAEEMGMTLNPINFVPFGELVPLGIVGRTLGVAGTALRYSGSILDHPFVRWTTHYSPFYAGASLFTGHGVLPAVGLALSRGVPVLGKGLQATGRLASEAGMELADPEQAAMLSQFRELGGVPEGILRKGVKMGLQGATAGGLSMAPFSLGAKNAQEAGEMFGFGMGAGAVGLGMREAAKNTMFQLSGGEPLKLSGESRIYGTPDDALNAQATANMSPESIAEFNRERHGLQAFGRAFILPEDVFDQRTGGAKGAGFKAMDVDGVPTTYYRGEAGFKQSKAHEANHFLIDSMTPEQRNEAFSDMLKRNDPSAYGTKYFSDLYGTPIKVDFDSLPDKTPVPGDPYGITKQRVMEEMLADMLSKGKSFSDITQNPDIIRSLQIGAGKLADHLGIPLTADETGQIRGVNPSWKAISAIETTMRAAAKDAARQGPTYGQAIPDPEIYFQDLKNALRKMNYAGSDATTLAEQIINEAKDQKRVVGLDDLFKRAVTNKWPEVQVAPPQLAIAASPQESTAATAEPPPVSVPESAPGGEPPQIAGPALVTPQGIEKGVVGQTHADIMNKAVQNGNESAAEALLDDQNHVFHTTDNRIVERPEGATIAVAAKQAPEGTTSLKSEDLKPTEAGQAAPEAAKAADFLVSQPDVSDRLPKEQIAELHRAIDRGEVKSEDDIQNWIEKKLSGPQGEALQAIKTLQDSGQPFTGAYVKTDGTLRTMTGQFGVQKGLKGGMKTTAKDPNLVTYYDHDAKGYRTFDINRLNSLQGEGVDFKASKKYMPQSEEPSEKIVSPAIRVNDIPFAGATIGEARAKAKAFGLSPDEIATGEQGFVTNKGAWKTPDEASTFTGETKQMGEQQTESPLSVQAFNRWRKFMPASDLPQGWEIRPLDEEQKKYSLTGSHFGAFNPEGELMFSGPTQEDVQRNIQESQPGERKFMPAPEKGKLTREVPERFFVQRRPAHHPEIVDRLTGEAVDTWEGSDPGEYSSMQGYDSPEDQAAHENEDRPPLPPNWTGPHPDAFIPETIGQHPNGKWGIHGQTIDELRGEFDTPEEANKALTEALRQIYEPESPKRLQFQPQGKASTPTEGKKGSYTPKPVQEQKKKKKKFTKRYSAFSEIP